MKTFSVSILHDGRQETYEQPQLTGLSIDQDTVELRFDPTHSNRITYKCDRNDLITVDIEV